MIQNSSQVFRPPFLQSRTPVLLQAALMTEYKNMVFEPVSEEAKFDEDYGAKVISGISSFEGQEPSVEYSPVSDFLMDLAYQTITPLIQRWAGEPLERSWGYGVRSYGKGSILHLHRDRVDTHVYSCIVHVLDRAPRKWPLDFIDHFGNHHEVTFDYGEMLFYESLCPHGRTQIFSGDYYRNMYLHWRPRNWDPSSYQNLQCKFSSIEEASADCKKLLLR